MNEYGVVCILEMTVKGENMKDARRVVEDALYEAFDSKVAKDCNPLIGRKRITVGGESIVFCGGL